MPALVEDVMITVVLSVILLRLLYNRLSRLTTSDFSSFSLLIGRHIGSAAISEPA
jgi:hypothetical protein